MQKYTSPAQWLEENYFNENGFTYTVVGDNTYAIKEELKELGFKWSPLFKWHKEDVAIDEPLPAACQILPLNYRDYLTWSEESGNMIPKATAKEDIENKIREAEGPCLSQYLTEDIGTRVRHLTVTLKSKRGFSSKYGWTNIFTFVCGDDILTWFTATDHDDLEVGATYDLTGTIKKKEEYKGTKSTQLSRCIVKEK
ncbi:MAG: hypothetical protein LUC37_00550 [Prevotella sp.]|nr:hypothetical protein [Prevotella sp.]